MGLGAWVVQFGFRAVRREVQNRSLKLRRKKLRRRLTPLQLFLGARERCSNAFLLESVVGPQRLAEYSFIGFDPTLTLQVKDGEAQVSQGSGCEKMRDVTDPMPLLRRLLTGKRVVDSYPRFAGGAVGYVSYDLVRCFERLPGKEDGGFPDIELGVYDDGVVYDHSNNECFYFHLGEDRSKTLEEMTKGREAVCNDLHASEARVNVSQERFEEMVARAKEYIAAGDILQAVLSKRVDLRLKGDLTPFYRALRRINPSPYMYFLQFGGRQVVGSSPEMLVRVVGRRVETFPIAGTRPVADDPVETERMARDLLKDEKELAEHLMLVDLARNDLGRVCGFGSVRVPEFMTVHRFSHVQHIVSRVVGELRGGLDAFDTLRAVFPAGTVSGAPKVRAMEIIDELECERRGPYAGAVGYLSYNGNADFAITIRTLVRNGHAASIQAGAGVVADSVPEREWLETEHKASALLKALRVAEEDTA